MSGVWQCLRVLFLGNAVMAQQSAKYVAWACYTCAAATVERFTCNNTARETVKCMHMARYFNDREL